MKLLSLIATISISLSLATAQNIEFEDGKKILEFTGDLGGWQNPVLPLDFNNDGETDLINFLDFKVKVYEGIGMDEFELMDIDELTGLHLKTIDFDDDGDQDVVSQYNILMNEGNGNFSLLNPGRKGEIIEVVDLDGDGNKDIVTQTNAGSFFNAQELFVFYNQGDGSYIEYLLHSDGNYSDLDFGDIDADGDIDLAVLDENEDFPLLIFTNEISSFTPTYSPHLLLVEGANLYLRDLDQDGDSDFLITTRFDSFYIIESNQLLFLDDQKTSFSTEQILYFNVGDLNNDGLIDIIFYGGNSSVQEIFIVEGKGNLDFHEPKPIAEFERPAVISPPNYNYVANNLSVYDYNQDGKNDIVYTDGFVEPNEVIVYLNNSVISNTIDIENQEMEIIIYPNPSYNSLYVKIQDNRNHNLGSHYKIYSTNGLEVKTGILVNGKIDISSLESGVYNLVLSEQKHSTKFIKL